MFVTGSTQNKLEILDYGGQGNRVLLLAGLGNTAHVYDDFAPRLTGRFRVYALTRRGFGASDHPQTGYDIKTLANDILAVTDSLRLGKVSLIGHSIAGEEMTRFATEHAERVRNLVYLDAAYDRTNVNRAVKGGPVYTSPAKENYRRETYRNYLKDVLGISYPDNGDELNHTTLFSATGSYVRDVSPAFVTNSILNQVESPAYRHIRCPALAIYAEPTSAQEVTPLYTRLDSANRKRANQVFPRIKSQLVNQQARFKREVAAGEVRVIKGANHYVFISHPEETVKRVLAFL